MAIILTNKDPIIRRLLSFSIGPPNWLENVEKKNQRNQRHLKRFHRRRVCKYYMIFTDQQIANIAIITIWFLLSGSYLTFNWKEGNWNVIFRMERMERRRYLPTLTGEDERHMAFGDNLLTIDNMLMRRPAATLPALLHVWEMETKEHRKNSHPVSGAH